MNSTKRAKIQLLLILCAYVAIVGVTFLGNLENLPKHLQRYEEFEVYKSDFETIAAAVRENGNGFYSMYIGEGVGRLIRIREKIRDQNVEIVLTESEQKSVFNVVSHSYESGLERICSRDNYVTFGWELYAGGIMYTEDIETGRKEYEAEFNSGEYGRENYKYKKLSENFYAFYDSPI